MSSKNISSNSSNNILLFSIEQWEFIRRLRNSGLTKDQICQAFDDLDRIERELGERLFHSNNSNNNSTATSSSILNLNENLFNLLQTQFNNNNMTTNTDTNLFAKQFQIFMAKNIAALNYQQRLNISTSSINNSCTVPSTTTPSLSSTTTTPSTTSSPSSIISNNSNNNNQTLNLTTTNLTNNSNNHVNNKNLSSPLSVNNNGDAMTTGTTLNSYEIDDDIKDLDEFRA